MPRVNEASWDRIIRVLLGATLLWLGLMSGMVVAPWSWVAAAAGAVMLVTGLLGVCPAYMLFGFSTCPTRK